MKGKVKKTAKRLTKTHRQRTHWQRFVRTLAMVVVFCTTYALILPAITMQSDAICGIDVHTHSDDCYQINPVLELICTQPEEVLHTHISDCYDSEGNITCEVPEVSIHMHGDECRAETGETERVLVCEKQAHTHTDACYPVEAEEPLTLEYHCGYAAHFHKEACLDENGNLVCSIPEHAHVAACVVEEVDLTADIESSADWETMITRLNLEDNWQENILAIANSQLGYAESERNCVLVADSLNGYTRYGDWYGNPYWEWDDMFVSFCLHYAGVPEEVIPRESDSARWLERLNQLKLAYTVEESLPEKGEVVFCKDREGNLFTAIVTGQEANPDADGLRLKLIAGDVSNQVDERTVSLDKVAAVLPVADIQHAYENDLLLAEPSEAVETTAPAETEPATEPEVPTELLLFMAETENYYVTVTAPSAQALPQGAQLRVTEYPRDSEIFRQRCEEAGYELEWLLNIGFYLGEDELVLNDDFEIVVTSKSGEALGQDITHFADSGTERINGSAEADNVSFSSNGFSDFGGGVARAAAVTYFTTVDPTQLKENTDYVIYCGNYNNVTLLSTNVNAISVNNSGQGNNPYQIGSGWSLSASQLGNRSENEFLWRVVRQNGQTYLVRKSDQQRLEVNNGWLTCSGNYQAMEIQKQGSGAYVGRRDGGRMYHLRYDDQWRGTWYDDGGVRRTEPTVVYFAAVGQQSQSANYPHAVHTGEVDINRLRFFNLCANGSNSVSALAGCTFEITGDNGYQATVVSGNSPEVRLPAGIPDGSYTITEVSTPEGYVRDTNPTRSFVIENGMLVSEHNIGTFINHNGEQLTTGKTAEVEDYNNRIYQVLLNAESHMRMYEMDPIDVLFVVDQSNSMLFPSGLNEIGKSVTLRADGRNNAANLDALNLDKTKMHYIISDPAGTSTAWAIWHDGTAWMYQDASYYAKAKHNNDPGYQDDNETVIFPTAGRSYAEQADAEPDGVRSNGGDISKSLSGSGLGKYFTDIANREQMTFTVYQSTDEYNRLHYLEESLANMIYELADVNPKNRVTLTRFTKEVGEDDCFGPAVELTTSNTEALIYAVTHIKTSGGTRQDIALEHIWNEHLSNAGEHYSDLDHTYTFLITDGAPVRSGSDAPQLGTPNDRATTAGNGTIYGRIKGFAERVRTKSQLMTVGLGMDDVEGGKQVLREIASNESFYCALDNARDLTEFMQKLVFESFRPKGKIETVADVVDEVSDSFYPIAWVEKGRGAATGRQVLVSDSTRDWILLQTGDWITLDGKFSTSASAPGVLGRKDDGTFYVTWENQTITEGWNGNLYLKAKEDFIGGNAIDTNKSASVTAHGEVRNLETPTVNVRLLDMNEMHSEVTLYLGDTVNGEGGTPLDSLRYFYENTKFTKLVSGLGDVLNQYDSADGLEAAAFYLRYAMGRDLTDGEWESLANGNTITVAYTYDDASSHGAVGYFTFRLEKSGTGSNYGSHEAISACQPGGHPLTMECNNPAEKYTLHVTYTAYKLGENGRPQKNVHNGNSSAGPGREVGTGSTIPTGMGVVAKHNIHEVHVISGQIVITKRFDEGTTDENDRTFTFTLHRMEDGEDTSKDVTKTITIPAGQTEGTASITFDNLKRGTYTVTEAEDEDYTVKHITVTNRTNVYSEPPIGSSGTTLLFTMGNNVANRNVISKAAETDRYTSYIDPVHGVLGVAEFTNGPIIFTDELPVEKIWSDSLSEHVGEAVFVVLYENDTPVMVEGGYHRVLRLDDASDWKGAFTIVLKDETDLLSNYHFSVREVSQTTTEELGWQKAILENDGSIIYYEEALTAGRLFSINGKGYLVQYSTDENGVKVITNLRTADLPETGGMGIHMYTFSGLLAIAAALMYGYSLWRKRERRGVR